MLQVNYIFNIMQIILFTFVTVNLVNSIGGRIVGALHFLSQDLVYRSSYSTKKKV